MVNDWQSIDEAPSAEPIILRGIPITEPKAFQRTRGRWFHLAAIASGLWRVSAWSVSILGHLVLMIVLVGILFARRPEKETLLEVSLYKGDAGEMGRSLSPEKGETSASPEKVREPEREAEKKSETVAKEPVEDPLPDEPLTPAEKNTDKTAKPDEKAREDDTIGSGSGSTTAPKGEGGKPVDPSVDPTKATKANRAGDLAKLRRGGEKEIVVVAGTYDHVERVLTALQIPHTRIEYSELGRYDLTQCLVLLLNCHSAMAQFNSSPSDPIKYKQQSEQLAKRILETEAKLEKAKASERRLLESELKSLRQSKRYYDQMYESFASANSLPENVRKFVDRGGYLFTSDWGLTLLQKLWPDHLAVGGGFGPALVRINATEKEAPLLEGVFVKSEKKTTTARDFRWDVDSGSYLIKVKSNRVITLVESPNLPSHRAVAVVFSPTEKSGRVLHVLSHFAKQADQYGEYALQNLLLNFLLERFVKQQP